MKLYAIPVVLTNLAHDLKILILSVNVCQFLVERRHALVQPLNVTHDSRQDIDLNLFVWVLHGARIRFEKNEVQHTAVIMLFVIRLLFFINRYH